SYPTVATAILSRFTDDLMDIDELAALCEDAYDYEVPLEHVVERRYVMRLDQGPTASFKDFAARAMGRLIGRLVKDDTEELVILTATSGDTGSAVAQAFSGVPNTSVVVLFPFAEVSTRQRKQMTTIGGNVKTIAVDGKFDDCQAMVKRAFADSQLNKIRLSSANSINIGRLLPQSVYYIYAYLQLADVAAGEQVVFSVPCGNFGNLVGGLLSFFAGLPVEKFVVATNANDEVPRFFQSELYEKIDPSRVCLSNAMNVGHPSNLARLVTLYGGQMDEAGCLPQLPDMERLRRDLYAVSVDDEQTRQTIARAWQDHKLILEPHGAVGWMGLERLAEAGQLGEQTLAISLETAHPAKFPDEVRALTGIEPELPPSLAAIETMDEAYETMDVDYDVFCKMLRDWYE
ncbi:MAG: threonine synthase, partial [Proteobacteria bacterium]|nr:threonine synthase [Pseudomonadota bacterium]